MDQNQNPASNGLICRACNSSLLDARRHQVREMFFGSREQFCYVECPSCGSLQIEQIPTDLSRFYPTNYYAQTAPVVYKENLLQSARYFLRGQLTLEQLGRKNFTGGLINFLHSKKTRCQNGLTVVI
jgi:hypothetical protein